MDLNVLSLLFLLAAIGVGFFLKVNTGLVAIGLSLVLGLVGGIDSKVIINGFPTSLFITLLGVMFLFSISQENGTLELMAKKAVSLSGKRTNLIPIVVFVFSTILAAVGPGTIPVMSLMAVFTCALAAEMKISPLLLSATSVLGAAAGGISPIAPTGILGISLAAKQGITGIDTPYFINSLIAQTVYFIVIYFVLGGHKMKSDVVLNIKDLPTFNKNQKITLVGIAVLVIGVIGFNLNVGLLSFTIALALLLLKVANEKKSIANVPWSTLILVCGVNVLMSIVIGLGGIKLLAAGLASIMTPFTAPSLLGLSAGIMSWFSSTSGVVMPTLIPTVSDIMSNVGGNVSAVALISAITNTAHVAGTSPISTGGSLGLASYVQTSHASEEDQRKLFIKQFLVAIGGVIVVALVAGTGVYTMFE
jgi:Na+/H+ antiporter NhaD/arsenite permease-like protein